MDNLIIKQYLRDSEIPFRNRENLALDIDTKKVDEATALKVLEAKYPGRYTIPLIKRPETPVQETAPTQVESVQEEVTQPSVPKLDMATAGASLGEKLNLPKINITDAFKRKDLNAKPTVLDSLASTVQKINPFTTPVSSLNPSRDQRLTSMADDLAKRYKWTDHTKQAFLGMKPEEQSKLLKGFGEDTLSAQIAGGAKESVGHLADLMYSYTAKPIIEQGIAIMRGGQALSASLPQIAQGDYKSALKTFDEVAAKPVEIGGEDYNIVAQAYDPETNSIDEEKLRQVFSGQQMQSGAGAMNIASFGSPAMAGSFWWNALAGAAMGGGESVEAGESAPIALLNAGARGLLQGTIAKVYSYAANKAKMNATDKALYKKKIGEQARSVFKDKANKKVAVKYLDDALDKVDDVQSKGAWKQPVQEVNKFMDDLTKVGDKLGKKVEIAKNSLKKFKVNPAPVKDSLDDMISKVNARTIGGKVKSIDFTGSDLDGFPTKSLNILDDIYRQAQKKTLNARNLESLTSRIEHVIGYAKQAGAKNAVLNGTLAHTKGVINKTLTSVSDDFGQANKNFAIWKTGFDKIRNAMKVGSGNNITYDPQNMLTKSLIRGGSEKYAGVYQTINDLASKFKLTAPSNLQNKAWIAYWAEDMTNTAPARSAEKVISPATLRRVIPTRTGKAIATVADVARRKAGWGDMTPIKTYVTSLKDILQKGIQTGGKVPNKALYEALAIITNIERVAQNPLTAPQLSSKGVYGETSPEDFVYEGVVTPEYTGLESAPSQEYITEEYTGL